MKNFNSAHEAYTHILIQKQEIEAAVKNIEIQMSFLLMNISKGNFEIESKKDHAMKELGYLVKGAHRLSEQAKELNRLSESLQTKLINL
jgi:hypothetical protein